MGPSKCSLSSTAFSVWQDFATVQGRTPRKCLLRDNRPERNIVYPGCLHPNLVAYISDGMTVFLQAEGAISLACPANLETKSDALRYVLHECGKEQASLFLTTGDERGLDTDSLHNQQDFPYYSFDDLTT